MTLSRDKNPTLATAAFLASAATLASRLLGLVRDAVLAAVFPKELTDVFWAAFRVPNTFRRLFGEGAVTAAFLPTFAKVRKKAGESPARDLLGWVLVTLILVTAFIALMLSFFSGTVVQILLDFPADAGNDLTRKTAFLVRWMAPYLTLVCVAAVVGGTLNATGRFFIPAVTPAFFNASVILTAVWAWHTKTTEVGRLAAGVILGGILQVVIQVPALVRSGFSPRLHTCTEPVRKSLREILLLFGPACLSLGVFQINTLVNTYFASTLGPGAISYLFYADRLNQFPLGVFGIAISTAAFPTLSKGALENLPDQALRDPLIQSFKGNLLILIPSMVGLWILADPLVDLLFNRGRFAEQGGLTATAAALRVYSLGLVPFATVKLMGSLSFAVKDGRSPVVAGIVSALTNFALACWLRKTELEHCGIALAVVLASAANLSVLHFRLRRIAPMTWFVEAVPFAVRVVAASILMGTAVSMWLVWLPWKNSLAVVGTATVLGGVVYLSAVVFFIGREIRSLIRFR